MHCSQNTATALGSLVVSQVVKHPSAHEVEVGISQLRAHPHVRVSGRECEHYRDAATVKCVTELHDCTS